MDRINVNGDFLQQHPMFAKCFRTSLMLFPILISGTLAALCILPLTRHGGAEPHSTFYVAADAFELALLVISTGVVLLLGKMLDQTYEHLNDETTGYGVFKLSSRRSSTCYRIFHASLCVLSLVTLAFKVTAVVQCLATGTGWRGYLHLFLYLFRFIFCIAQLVFINVARNKRCNTIATGLLIMVIVSGNICLCVRCMSDAALHAMLDGQFSDPTLTYDAVFCTVSNRHWINAFDIIDRYFYTFIFAFCLYSIGALNVFWSQLFNTQYQLPMVADSGNYTGSEASNAVPTETDNNTDQAVHNGPLGKEPERRTIGTKIKNTIIQVCLFVCNHSIMITGIICIAILATNTYQNVVKDSFDVRVNETSTKSDYAYSWIQTVYGYVISILAFVGFLLVLHERFHWSKLQYKHVLLVFTALIHFTLQIFETVDAIANTDRYPKFEQVVLFLLKIILYYPGVFCQTIYIIKCSNISFRQTNPDSNKPVYLYGVLCFLGVCNLERAIADTVLTPATLYYANNIHDDFLGAQAWRIITRVFYPGIIFYRIHSFLLCLEKVGCKCLRNE